MVCISWERTGGLRAYWCLRRKTQDRGGDMNCLCVQLRSRDRGGYLQAEVAVSVGVACSLRCELPRVSGFTHARVAWSRVSEGPARATNSTWRKCNHDDAWKVLWLDLIDCTSSSALLLSKFINLRKTYSI